MLKNLSLFLAFYSQILIWDNDVWAKNDSEECKKTLAGIWALYKFNKTMMIYNAHPTGHLQKLAPQGVRTTNIRP